MGILENLKHVLGGKKTGKAADQHGVRKHTVQSGETLFRIASQYYGDGSNYMKIFEANRNILKDPNLIKVGQKLRIP